MADHGHGEASHGSEAKSHGGGVGKGVIKESVNAAADFALANGLGIVKDLPDVIGEFFGAGGSHGKSSGGHAAKH
jgi:hypothetical protein